MKLYLHTSSDYDQFVEKFVRPVASLEFDIVQLRMSPDDDVLAVRKRFITEALVGEDVFVFTGADVVYAKPVKDRMLEILGDADMACQLDSIGGYCTDFFMMRPSDRTRNFWAHVCEVACPATFYEQGACNQAIAANYAGMKCVPLPMDEFFNCCACGDLHGSAKPGWRPTHADIPKSARIVHASCVYFPDKFDTLTLAQRYLD